MALDMFCSSLSNASFQPVGDLKLESAVRAGNDFCSIQMLVEKARIPVRRIDEATDEEHSAVIVTDQVHHFDNHPVTAHEGNDETSRAGGIAARK